ncbi:uncharacterized protein JCM15063_002480 [Sporobolomyces koalae]|uniref:uncharacterized protein n=1 Tax=Sporobolomyces koalae TaxID=500713 RepID=UPI0031749B18
MIRHPGRQRSFLALLAALLVALSTVVPAASAASLLAIDYGTDSFKASLVKPGVPFDVLLTKEGKRKVPTLVSIRGQDRFVGGDAANLATRFPQDTVSSVKLLLGHSSAHPQSQLHSTLFATPQSTTQRGTPAVSTSGMTIPVEEVLAMQFTFAKELAEEQANENVREAVVTVPGWYNEQERRAVLDAAEIAGLRVLGLVNDGSAVAVNYAMTRSFPPTPSYHLIYDLGSGSLRTTLVSFKSAMLPDPLSLSETPVLRNATAVEVHGFGFDVEVGGYVFDNVVREIMIEGFEATTGKQLEAGKSVRKDKRAMAKLTKEAGRVKQVLSANTAASARIEGLIDDLDFRFDVTREELEARSTDTISRLTRPIQDALDIAKLSLDDIESLIFVGGSSRVPMVQHAVASFVGEDKIAKNVNADEAAVLGAGLYGAGITRGFRTKDIRVQDLSPYAIDVAYEAENSKDGSDPRIITTHLFPANSKTGNKKTLTLRKTDDAALDFSYRKTGAASDSLIPSHLFSTTLKGISPATSNLTAEQKANATVQVTIELDESGFVKVGKATLVLREEVDGVEAKAGVTDKLKGLFNKFGAKKDSTSATTTSTSSTADAESTADATKEDAEATLSAEEQAQLDDLIKQSLLPPAKTKLDVETVQPIEGGAMSTEEKSEVKKRLRDAKASLQRKLAREEARNTLEAYIYRVRDLLDQSSFISSSVESERKAIKELNDKSGDWLWDEGESAKTLELKEKKRDLEKLVKHILNRSIEATSRPALITRLREVISSSAVFHSTAISNQTATAADAIKRFTSDELDNLTRLVSNTTSWLEDLVKKQDRLKGHEDPLLKTSDLEKKIKELENEVKRLAKKKIPRAKKVKPVKTEKDKDQEQSDKSTDSGHKKDEL